MYTLLRRSDIRAVYAPAKPPYYRVPDPPRGSEIIDELLQWLGRSQAVHVQYSFEVDRRPFKQ